MDRESALTNGGNGRDGSDRSSARGAVDGPATLNQVAAEAGVSRATVSRVVNGSPKVSPEVRRSVERAVARLGYTPNLAARSLVTRRSDSIGVVITEPTDRLFQDPFFPRLLRGISGELADHGLQLVLLMPENERDESRVAAYVASGHVDGAILVSLHGADPLPGQLLARDVALVTAARPPQGVSASYVDVDNRDGARTAVTYLLELGRRRIATIAGPADMPAGLDRLLGYREALQRAGVAGDPALEATADFTIEGGADAMAQLLERAPDIDAVFVASDLMAAGALGVLRAAGRSIPGDVAVIGYDDSAIAVTTDPPLTSVRQPIEEMGRELVRLLVSGLRAKSSVNRHVILATQLIRRGSTEGGGTR